MLLRMICSITLQRMQVSDMGLCLAGSDLWLFTNACSQSLGSLPVLYDCWKIWVMMGAICFAVSLRTLAGSSSGPVALFWFRFSSCFITPDMPISRMGCCGK